MVFRNFTCVVTAHMKYLDSHVKCVHFHVNYRLQMRKTTVHMCFFASGREAKQAASLAMLAKTKQTLITLCA